MDVLQPQSPPERTLEPGFADGGQAWLQGAAGCWRLGSGVNLVMS